MNSFDKYYLALGLQRGATQEEIRSAFRQMVKQYHPDKDSSLDAQMKYHEARQAYAALSIPADFSFTPEPPNTATRSWTSGSSNSTTGGRQQAAYNYGSTGFTNQSANAKDSTNSAGFNDFTGAHASDDYDYDDILGDLTKTPAEKDVLPAVTLHDYFFQVESILIIMGTMLLFYVMRQQMFPFLLADELSARFLVFTTIFVFVSWLIIGYARVTRPARSTIYIVTVLLGLAYSSLITYVVFQQEHAIYHAFVLSRPRVDARTRSYGAVAVIIVRSMKFYFMFFCATRLLEATIKHRLRKRERLKNA